MTLTALVLLHKGGVGSEWRLGWLEIHSVGRQWLHFFGACGSQWCDGQGRFGRLVVGLHCL